MARSCEKETMTSRCPAAPSLCCTLASERPKPRNSQNSGTFEWKSLWCQKKKACKEQAREQNSELWGKTLTHEDGRENWQNIESNLVPYFDSNGMWFCVIITTKKIKNCLESSSDASLFSSLHELFSVQEKQTMSTFLLYQLWLPPGKGEPTVICV